MRILEGRHHLFIISRTSKESGKKLYFVLLLASLYWRYNVRSFALRMEWIIIHRFQTLWTWVTALHKKSTVLTKLSSEIIVDRICAMQWNIFFSDRICAMQWNNFFCADRICAMHWNIFFADRIYAMQRNSCLLQTEYMRRRKYIWKLKQNKISVSVKWNVSWLRVTPTPQYYLFIWEYMAII